LPGYRLALEIEARGRRLLAFEPCGQPVDGLVPSGTLAIVPSGTGHSCYREPGSGSSISKDDRIRGRNLESNSESNSCCAAPAGDKPAHGRALSVETHLRNDKPERPLGTSRRVQT
jgi:plasmid replication initiation protein